MIKTNSDKLIMQSVKGEISHPSASRTPYVISAEGKPVVLPSVGGITYNVRIGDAAVGWAADHVEPGVSLENNEKTTGPRGASAALNTLACIGNEVTVISGDAKGEKGFVVGKHGGIEHVMVDFTRKQMEKMAIGDKMQIMAYGTGLTLTDYYPSVHVMNISPALFSKIPLNETDGYIEFPVTHIVPAAIMGSGLGSSHVYSGDYDIQLFDKEIVEQYSLDTLKFGDFVAIIDADHRYGRIYKSGSVSVGVIVHSDCVIAGHGPGVMTVMTAGEGKIVPLISKKSNLASYLKLLKK